jgi:hypothetical protein
MKYWSFPFIASGHKEVSKIPQTVDLYREYDLENTSNKRLQQS